MNTRSRTRSGGAPVPASPVAIKKKTAAPAGARSKAKAAPVDKAAPPAAAAATAAAAPPASAADKAKTTAVAEDGVATGKAAPAAKKGGKAAAGNGAAAKSGGGLAVGDAFPATKLMDDSGAEVDLGEVLKTKGLVLFMYPKANTPGCTKQACGFREHTSALADAGFAVYGMSADTPTAQMSWKKKHNLSYPLLCDRDLALIKAIGAFKAPKNIKRSHIIVAKGGKVLDVRVQIGPEDSFTEAVKFVEGLSK